MARSVSRREVGQLGDLRPRPLLFHSVVAQGDLLVDVADERPDDGQAERRLRPSSRRMWSAANGSPQPPPLVRLSPDERELASGVLFRLGELPDAAADADVAVHGRRGRRLLRPVSRTIQKTPRTTRGVFAIIRPN